MRSLLSVVLMSLLAAAAAPASAQESGEAPEDDLVYRIQPGDVIGVQVLEDSSLNRELLVQPDGRVSFPLAGVVMAGGRTPEELQNTLSQELAADFLQAPTVTVSLQSSTAFSGEGAQALQASFYVLGQVPAPGQFPILKPVTILQALAVAGGPGVFAAKDRIQIRKRNEDGIETVSLFDYEALEDGEAIDTSIEINDGDVIFVPESGFFE